MNIKFSNDFEGKLKLFKKLNKNFKTRYSLNYKEIIFEDSKLIFTDKKTQFQGLFLFRLVKNDIQNYLLENEVIALDKLPTNFTNINFDSNKKIIGVDINNAYWSIAYRKGYISEKTYLKGIEKKEYKVARLSALSTLGKERSYRIYESGKWKSVEIKKQDNDLIEIYNDIRYTTFALMYEISLILKNEFHSWKTDCIFCTDNELIINKVTQIIESYGLTCKVEMPKQHIELVGMSEKL